MFTADLIRVSRRIPSKLISHPVAYSVFIYLTIALVSLLLIGLFYYSYRIYGNWNQVILRHRFFFEWSFLMVIIVFFLIISGLYQSYETNGVQILILFMMCNFYVIVLQFLWRFNSNGKLVNFSLHSQFEGSFEKTRDKIGMNYFDQNTEVEFSHSTIKSGDKENGSDKEKEYVPFDEEADNHSGEQTGPFVEGVLTFGNHSADETGHLEEEDQDSFRGTKSKIGKEYSKVV